MTLRRACVFCSAFLAMTTLAAILPAAELTAERSAEGDRVTIKIDGHLFTEYITRSGAKPILWPIMGPTDKPMTRSWPMGELGSHEKADHIHQRSFWFTHGDVNGHDFWAEKAEQGRPLGTIQHRKFVKICSGTEAVVATQNDWMNAENKRICADERTLTFGVDGESHYIDLDITITATDGPVTFGDTKEGSFGIRMAATMQPDAKLGGRLVNSNGLEGEDAWGKPAAWVDYYGPVGDETVGIALMNHPSSFRYPTPWHARGYGLCAANPFGLKDFDEKASSGAYTIPNGKSITLRYRMVMHKGDTARGAVAKAYDAYASMKK